MNSEYRATPTSPLEEIPASQPIIKGVQFLSLWSGLTKWLWNEKDVGVLKMNLGKIRFLKNVSIQCGKTKAVGGINWVGRVRGNIGIFFIFALSYLLQLQSYVYKINYPL